MTTKECYEYIGGNYDEALRRLMRDDMIAKFASKFLEDKSYSGLVEAMEQEDYDQAFRMAHTLKGVCQNLSFTSLGNKGNELTESLRDGSRDIELAKQLYVQVEKEYKRTVDGLKMLLGL